VRTVPGKGYLLFGIVRREAVGAVKQFAERADERGAGLRPRGDGFFIPLSSKMQPKSLTGKM
jgi:hypothetical protein